VLRDRSRIHTSTALDLISPQQLEITKEDYFIHRRPYHFAPTLYNSGVKSTLEISAVRGANPRDCDTPISTEVIQPPSNVVSTVRENLRTKVESMTDKRKNADKRLFRQELPILGSKSNAPLIEDNSTTPTHPVLSVSRHESKVDNESVLDKIPLLSSKTAKGAISNIDIETFMRQLKCSKQGNKKMPGNSLIRSQLLPRVSSLSINHREGIEKRDRLTYGVEPTYIFGSPSPLSKNRLYLHKTSSKGLTPPNIIRRTSTEMGIPYIIPDLPSCMSQDDQEGIAGGGLSDIDNEEEGVENRRVSNIDEKQDGIKTRRVSDINDEDGFFPDLPSCMPYQDDREGVEGIRLSEVSNNQEGVESSRVSDIDEKQEGIEGRRVSDIDDDDYGFFLEPPPFVKRCSSLVKAKRIKTSPRTFDEMIDVLDDDFFGLGLLSSF